MAEILQPDSEEQLVDLVHWALAGRKRLGIEGYGTYRGFAFAPAADATVSMQAFNGITDYQPAELVMTARAATPRAVVEAALAGHRQQLAFEPPALGPLYGKAAASGSIGGVFLANLSGPRRFCAGAARDHLLGVRGVSGRGEAWKSGGRVIKNVTGYDLSKLMAGSWGTLSVLTEVTFKVLPAPPASASLLLSVAEPRPALALLSRLARNPSRPTGLAYLPEAVAAHIKLPLNGTIGASVCVARVEGSATAVREHTASLRTALRGNQEIRILEDTDSQALWSAIRDVHALAACPIIIRVSLPPFRARELVEQWPGMQDCRWYADAAGGCLWLGLEEDPAVRLIGQLRQQLAGNGSAIVWRAPDHVKRAAGVFSIPPPALASLTRQIRHSFDPEQILNPGRLVPL